MKKTKGTPPVTPLRKARRIQKIKVKDAAAKLEVSVETWRRWERGLNMPSYPEAVAAFLNRSVEELWPNN